MAKKGKKSVQHDTLIIANKKAKHEFHIEDSFEAGLMLSGWEVKSLRAGKAQLIDSYVLLKDGEGWLIGASITPLPQACTHVVADPRRDRKLLLHKRELAKLFAATSQKGYTCVALKLYWKKQLVKCEIALVKGKQLHDKRQTEKERDWNREKQRMFSRPA